MKGNAETGTVCTGGVEVGEAPDVVYAQNLEYIVDAGTDLHIRSASEYAYVCIFREAEERMVVSRIVAFAKSSPEALKIHNLP